MTNLGLKRIPYRLLWLSAFVLPWEEIWVAFGSFGTIGLLSVVLVFAATSFSIVLGEKIKPLNFFLVAAGLFVLWGGTTIIWSINPDLSVRRFVNYLARLAFIWLIWQASRSRRDVLGLMEAYLWGCFVLGLLTLENFFWGDQFNYGRYSPPDIDPNYMAFTIALAFPMFICLVKQEVTGKRKLLYGFLMSVGVVAIMLSGSRGGFVALAIGVITTAAFFWRDIFRNATVVAVILVLLGASMVPYADALDAPLERLTGIGDEIASGDWSKRLDVWETGLRLYVNNMFWGVGLQGFPAAIGTYSSSLSGFYAHNTYLTILVEQGLFGFVNFLLIIAALLLAIWHMPATEKKSMLTLILVWAAGSYALNWDHHRATWFIWGIIAAYAGFGQILDKRRSNAQL